MNRRDTILISVLVNMAILTILFVFAVKPSTPSQIAMVQLNQDKKIEKPQKIEEKVSLDQVDNLLSKFVAEEVKSHTESVPIFKDSEVQPELKKEIHHALDPSVKEIIVKQGDSLDKIAKIHKTTISEIMKLNRLNDTRLHIGQILYIPRMDESFFEPKKSTKEFKEKSLEIPASNEKADIKYYIVKHGDNPWTIAIKNGIKVEELLKLNHLDENKAKKLKPGDKLRIQ